MYCLLFLPILILLSQAVAKRRDLSTMLAFMPIVHVDKNVIQGILSAIPGKRSDLTKHFRGDVKASQTFKARKPREFCRPYS